MSMDVMHFRNDAFNISVDTDADQEDKRLHQELKQLIAEQFEDFDLGDDPDTVSDSRCVSNDEDADALDNDKLELNTEEIASINAAGKLSLLEGAIQKFGDDDTQASGDTLTDHLPARSLGTLEGFQPNPPIHVDLPRTPPYGPVIDSNNSNPNEHLETRDHDHWPKSPDVHKHIEATKAPTLIQNGGVREPYFVDETINWELSLPGEVGNALFLALQNNRDTPVESVQATERCAQKTEADVSTSESVTCAQSGSPVVASGTLQRLFPGIFNEPPLGAQNTQNVGYLNMVFPGASRVVSRWTVNESTNSVSVGDVQPPPDHSLPAQTSQDSELPHLPFNPEERRELLYTARGHQVEQLTAEVGRLREEIAKEKRLASHRAVLAEGERETLCAKLTASEKLVQSLRADLKEHEDQVNKLRQRLTESETCKNELNTEITNLRSTNESLSTQLVELTTGDALRRVEAREDKLTEALERRYATVAEEVKEELTIANRRIAEKVRLACRSVVNVH
ncbi:hypothetical protein D915_010504 [Fasciola hepatica]|uniref:Uncharacterized protein n=1 Tax=Fasciola hepatica TaxID=6192 RepID=A0A4E0QXY1_FASHE|nr:hypothetical protein D915_010504 [Fasciola hepatica]